MSLSDKILKNWEWKTDMIEAKHVREAIREFLAPYEIPKWIKKRATEIFGEELTK